jgi:hypothetical protein
MNYKTSALILAVAWTAIVAVEITLKIDAVCDLSVGDKVHNQFIDKRGVVRDVKDNCKVAVVYSDNTISSSLNEKGVPEPYDFDWKF